MSKHLFRRTGIALVLTLAGAFASAQQPTSGEKAFEATITSIDYEDRMITVRLHENDAVETYPVAEDADITYYNGIMEVEEPFTGLVSGQTVMLEFGGIEGEPTLGKITRHDDKSDDAS